MGPAILARAGVAPFAAKIHGSALEYTVKPHPRFLPYAEEGMEAAAGVLVGSRHTAESLWAALPDVPDLREKTRLGPPGVDIEEFRPGGAEREPAGRLRRQADRLQGRRPAARRLAAGPRRPSRARAADRRLRRVRGRPAAPARGPRARRPRRRPRGRPARPRPRGRGGGAAADPLRLPRRPARRLRSRPPARPPARSS